MVMHPLYISVRLTDNKNTNKQRLDLIYCLIKTDTELQLGSNKSERWTAQSKKKPQKNLTLKTGVWRHTFRQSIDNYMLQLDLPSLKTTMTTVLLKEIIIIITRTISSANFVLYPRTDVIYKKIKIALIDCNKVFPLPFYTTQENGR